MNIRRDVNIRRYVKIRRDVNIRRDGLSDIFLFFRKNFPDKFLDSIIALSLRFYIFRPLPTPGFDPGREFEDNQYTNLLQARRLPPCLGSQCLKSGKMASINE